MHKYSPSNQSTTHIIYPTVPQIQCTTPDNCYPIAPSLKQGCILVALPLHEMTNPVQQLTKELNITQCLQAKPSTWEDPLWHWVTKHGPLYTLSNAITAGKTIIITSNASVIPTGQGACTWVLWSTSILWHGEGYVPGPPDKLYSGLAKAYGVYMAIQFFQNYLNLFPSILPPDLANDLTLLWQVRHCWMAKLAYNSCLPQQHYTRWLSHCFHNPNCMQITSTNQSIHTPCKRPPRPKQT